MKWMTWILLLVNIAVAGFFIGREHWLRAASPQTESLNVSRLSLRGQSESAQADAPSLEKPAQATALCVEWRGLRQGEFVQAREQLKTLTGEQVISFSEVPLNTRYWVIFPPLPSPLAAAAKHAELAAVGVRDTYVVKQGDWRNAISLGLYANTETARRRVSELETKGVLGTRIEMQARQGTDYYFVIRSDDPDVLKSLNGIKQAYPNSQQSRVACPS